MKTTLTSGFVLPSLVLLALLFHSCSKYGNTDTQIGEPLITAKGEPFGEAVSASIGQDGGELTSPDGILRLSVPAGALSSTTTVSIQPITSEAPLGVGPGYRLLPEGLTFAKPVQLIFSYEDLANSNPGDNFLWVVTQASDGSWNALIKSEMNKVSHTVTGNTTHFSDWSLGRFVDLSIEPAGASILKGQTIQLKLSGFAKDQAVTDDDELAPLIPITGDGEGLTPLTPIPAVESRLMDFRVKKWNLNGNAAPVTNENGSLTASGNSATYKAPDKTPPINPVSVSANLETTNKEGAKFALLLNSTITIVDDEYYVRVQSEGKTYLYYQYGINTTTPEDPALYGSVIAGITNEGAFGIIAAFVDSPDGNSKDFGMRLYSPAIGSNTMTGIAGEGDDDLWLWPVPERFFQLDYIKRSRAANGTCNTIPAFGDVSVKLTVWTGVLMSEVVGTFSGTIYEDPLEYSSDCKSADPRTIKGDFRLILTNYFSASPGEIRPKSILKR